MTDRSTPARLHALPAHLPLLDSLRGMAVLFVLFDMLNVLQNGQGLGAYFFERLSSIGWVGVQLFFVLSGFLITGILLDTQRAKNYFSGFYARRTLRIFPLYFLVLGTAFIALPLLGWQPSSLAADQKNQWWLWCYLSNWAPVFGQGSHTFTHFWSLAVEEQFYLIWPLMMWHATPRKCLQICVAVALLSLLIRVILVSHDYPFEWIYQNSFCRMDALALGGAAAAYIRMPGKLARMLHRPRRLNIFLLLTTVVGAVITRGFWNDTVIGASVGYSLVALIFTLLVLRVTVVDVTGDATRGWRLLRGAMLRRVGKYSYAIYILHLPFHHFVGRPLLARLAVDVTHSVVYSALYMIAAIVICYALAWLSWHLYEKHFLALKHRFAATH